MARVFMVVTAVGRDRRGTVEMITDREVHPMQSANRSLAMSTLLLIVTVSVWSCASSHLLRVHYQLPATSDSLAGARASLSLEDMRRNKAFLSQNARNSLSDFSGYFTLRVSNDSTGEKLLGAFDLTSAVKEVFKQRLLHAGITVVDQKEGIAEIQIVLKEFMLDLQGRDWIFNMSYQANIMSQGTLTVSETITGNAQRLKTIGTGGAEKVISELVTDMVNKLNIAELIRRAGL
jgi:hypothetical protein